MKSYLRVIIVLIMASYYSTSAQDIVDSRGPLRIRNQFPIGLQFLSFAAENALTEPKDRLQISIQYDHSNTFAMSHSAPNGLNGTDRRVDYLPDNLNNGNEYFIDSEIGRINFNLQYGASDHFTLGIDIPLLIYQGGFLDAPIEIFHNAFGINNYNRSKINTNNSRIYLSSEENNYFASGGLGIGDVVLSFKTNLFQSYNHNFSVSLLGAIKLPTGNYKNLTGSGSFDYGFNLITTNFWGRHFITNNISFVLPGQWKLFPENKILNTYSWLIGYELIAGSHYSFIFQHRVHTSPISAVDYPSAAKPSFEWSTGAKIDVLKNLRLSMGITQNYINHENVPDFGFHLGIQRFF